MIDKLKLLFSYDTVEAKKTSVYRRCAYILIAAYIVVSAILIFGQFIDNKPTNASTALVGVHRMVTLDFEDWFTDGIWWRGKQTPSPLPYTGLGVLFYGVGYSPQWAMMLHALLGAASLFFIYKITERRFSPESGLTAVLMCGFLPLFLWVTWSGWTVIWALAALAGAVNFLDLYVQTRRKSYYALAALLILCAGMSRPEYYATAFIVALFVPAPIALRPMFIAIAFSYPFAAYIHNYVLMDTPSGLRILDDARSSMAWHLVLFEWAKDLQRSVLGKSLSVGGEILALFGLLIYGISRARFLASLVLYFVVAFAGAYTMRRISFNHEAYYVPHLMLAAPFAAALLWNAVRKTASVTIRTNSTASAVAWGMVVLALAANLFVIRHTFAARAWYQVHADVKQVRDFIRDHGGPEAPVLLDYHEDMTWLRAEIEVAEPYPVWIYMSTSHKRPPVNVGRPDATPEEHAAMGAWVKKSFEEWVISRKPKYLVTPTDTFYAQRISKRKHRSIYRMLGIRNAYNQGSLIPLYMDGSGENVVLGEKVLTTKRLVVYEIDVRQGAPIVLFECRYEDWETDSKVWDHVSRGIEQQQVDGNAVWVMPPAADGSTSISRSLNDTRLVGGAVLKASVRARASDRGKLIMTLTYILRDREKTITFKPEHPGDGSWRELAATIRLPENVFEGKIYFGVTLREGAKSEAYIDDFEILLLNEEPMDTVE